MGSNVERGRGDVPGSVEKAEKGVERAITRLIRLLGVYDRPAVERTLQVLVDLGSNAFIGPMLTVLGRRTSAARTRLMIMAVLLEIAPEHSVVIGRSLVAMIPMERDPIILAKMKGLLMKTTVGVIGAHRMALQEKGDAARQPHH